ncbi:aminoglycoside N3'-acetyltransferase [Campylobacter lari]|uniref:AAC(3) family N-acetyltransferase n=1 Tax=Campylobacter lari TaxID=201 RepID=UPI002152AB4E|nr:AAC(3) family N-acetyltransferase [Campylobacter lari]MCR6512817.1 AAC(3) family N-acetyltransferase [Campylobacter lari]
MKYFLEHNDKKYSNADLIEAFKKLGIKKGDILCVHTELFNFGTPLLPRNEFLQTILDCFFEVIGKEGTLIMPTFTYSFCKNEVYDKLNSPTKMGALNEYFRKQSGVKRTNDPIFSFAIKGAKEKLFLKDTTSCFGENCVYDVLIKENGKFITFGGIGHTITHHIEEKYQVDYRYFKKFQGFILDENGEKQKKEILYFVRDLNKHSLPNIENIIKIALSSFKSDMIKFANDNISIFIAQEYENAIIRALNINKNVLILKDS